MTSTFNKAGGFHWAVSYQRIKQEDQCDNGGAAFGYQYSPRPLAKTLAGIASSAFAAARSNPG
jgi:hypothetical protein